MKHLKITVNGTEYDVTVEEVGAEETVSAPVAAPVAKPTAPKQAAPAGKQGATQIKAPMPGTIVKVNVAAGDTVKKGAELCILEAMKMENEILAPKDGKVVSVNVKKGDNVATDAVIVTME